CDFFFFKDHLFQLESHKFERGRGRCPFDPTSSFTSILIGGELFTGLYSDYWGRDAAVFRTMNRMAHLRTEPDSERLLKGTENRRRKNMEPVSYLNYHKCLFLFMQNDMGGQRMLVNKWSTFLKTRLVCSVPGRNGIDTHFDELEDVFLLQTRDNKNPVIFGLFSTTSNIFRGYAICVYHMASVRAAFNGPYAHKEGPEYHWALYEGKVPYPRPGSVMNGGLYTTTKDYPDEAIHFARSHPLMYQPIKPVHKRPILVKTDGKYNLKQIAVDRVEAEDGQYDVLFIGTGKIKKTGNTTVKTDDRIIKMELGLLFLKLHRLDAGTYFCQTVEHSIVHTVRKITLEIVEEERVDEMFNKDYEEEISHKMPCPMQSNIPQVSKPWYKEFLQLIGYSNFQRVEEYCEKVWCTDKKRKKLKMSPSKWKYASPQEKKARIRPDTV
uniref:Semaphorin 3E n=1 Tax=Pavo cristatus TaxID=9049 RepID=A0A8C9G495_PAVCR